MGAWATRKSVLGCAMALWLVFTAFLCEGQVMPSTVGETLSGHRLVLAQAVRGHVSIVIASFSREAGNGAEQWSKAVRADPTLAPANVFVAAMLERAPSFIRGPIKSGLRKDVPVAAQDTFAILTQDDSLWRGYFGVTTDKDPYVVLIDVDGQIRWHGHGSAANLESLLKGALK